MNESCIRQSCTGVEVVLVNGDDDDEIERQCKNMHHNHYHQ